MLKSRKNRVKPVFSAFLPGFSGIASVSHPSFIILMAPRQEAKFFSKESSFSKVFLFCILIFNPKKLIKYFSILETSEPPPVSKKCIPDDKLNPVITNCFFNFSKISSNLAFIIF